MITDPLNVLLVGLDEATERDLAREVDLTVRRVDALGRLEGSVDADAVILQPDASGPLEAIRALREHAETAAIVVVTPPDREADGTVALHAGAEDHLVAGPLLGGLLPRAIRYAVEIRRLRRELATTDDVTSLPNLRGFVPIAEHHLRMADRTARPVIFVFLRLDDHDVVRGSLGQAATDELARDAASVILDAVRDADVPARIAPDTFCVLLTGEAEGAETVVLSRLVESIAVHDVRRDQPRSLALSVGTARYEPGTDTPLSRILEAAERGMGQGARS
jgi:diguanylate cyclase (GGDEF)-like protein